MGKPKKCCDVAMTWEIRMGSIKHLLLVRSADKKIVESVWVVILLRLQFVFLGNASWFIRRICWYTDHDRRRYIEKTTFYRKRLTNYKSCGLVFHFMVVSILLLIAVKNLCTVRIELWEKMYCLNGIGIFALQSTKTCYAIRKFISRNEDKKSVCGCDFCYEPNSNIFT